MVRYSTAAQLACHVPSSHRTTLALLFLSSTSLRRVGWQSPAVPIGYSARQPAWREDRGTEEGERVNGCISILHQRSTAIRYSATISYNSLILIPISLLSMLFSTLSRTLASSRTATSRTFTSSTVGVGGVEARRQV